jgi:hypothetical protein
VSYGSLGDRFDVGFLELSIDYFVKEIICFQELSAVFYDLSDIITLKPVHAQ